ncbi:MAG: MFS transporter [Longimicrobiales bacterium]
MSRPSTRARLGILFLTVFLDLVGFGIVLPLLPFYADRFGASGTDVGLLITVYSVAQLFLAPLWGRLSDRVGRRPILILGLLGSAVSYVVFAFAGSLSVLFLSRILAGIGGATVPVAQAYIADITPPEKRAGNLGLIGAAFGLGFIFGPALGGILAPIAPEAPGLAAAALCLGNGILALVFLPESLSEAEREARAMVRKPFSTKDFAVAIRNPITSRILLLAFLFTVAFAAMQPTFPLFGAIRFSLDERHVGYLFAFLGTISATVQGGLVRKLVPVLGETRLIQLSGLPFIAGLLAIAFAQSIGWLLLGLALLALGFGGTLPSIASLLSRVAPPELQGSVLGIGQSVGSLARIVGPTLAGIVYDLRGIAWPYLGGAGVAGAALLVALTLRPLPGSGPRPGD